MYPWLVKVTVKSHASSASTGSKSTIAFLIVEILLYWNLWIIFFLDLVIAFCCKTSPPPS